MDAGAPLSQVAREEFPAFVRYNRGFEKYLLITRTERCEKPEVIVIIGPPGVGKTHMAREIANAAGGPVYWHPPGQWWPNYAQQHTVVLDDFKADMTLHVLQLLLDQNPFMVETKGGHVQFNSPLIIITSNREVCDWYRNIPEAEASLSWRINKLIHIGATPVAQPLHYNLIGAAQGTQDPLPPTWAGNVGAPN